MTKIYTKTGDTGMTSLFGGKRVSKDDLRVEACGKVDELNSMVGLIISGKPAGNLVNKLLRIQRELFVLGSDLATPLSLKQKVPRVKNIFTLRLEKEIDEVEKKLPRLNNFILPGGGEAGSRLHLARGATRCLERIVVSLGSQDKINSNILPYINRLSDWFFVLARHTNLLENYKEEIWVGRS